MARRKKTRKEGFNTEDTESGEHGGPRAKSGHEIGWYFLDSRRIGAYCRRTLVGTPGASHFSQVLHRRANGASPTLREVCEWRDAERASNVLRRAACQPESPGGHHYVETVSGPACDCDGSSSCTGGSSADGTDADGVHVCKPVQCAAGELGGVLGG